MTHNYSPVKPKLVSQTHWQFKPARLSMDQALTSKTEPKPIFRVDEPSGIRRGGRGKGGKRGESRWLCFHPYLSVRKIGLVPLSRNKTSSGKRQRKTGTKTTREGVTTERL